MRGSILLALTIISELIATTSLKLSAGFTRPLPSLLVILGYGTAFYLLSKTLIFLPLGTAYAIWAGVGTAGTAIIGVLLWKEPVTLMRVTGISLIVLGVVLLNQTGDGH